MVLRLELTFPDAASLSTWLESEPAQDAAFSIGHDVVPNDAERCPPPGRVLALTGGDGRNSVLLRRDDVDPWHAVALVCAAQARGGLGRALVTQVPYQWEEDLLDLLLTLRADGTDSATLSGRQAQAYEASEDLPPLKEMKARLRDARSTKKP